MLKPYIVSFKYKPPGDKKAGAIKQYRLYANNDEEARRLISQQATYPDIEVLKINPT